jgi:hypothetical protein
MEAEGDRLTLSGELETWLCSPGGKSVGGLVDVFGKRSFAIVFVVLMGPSALPLPTGGITNVFEVVTMVTALQLVVGRDKLWLPERWRRRAIDPGARSVTRLVGLIRRLERFSRPRVTWVFGHRLSNAVFGLLVTAGAVAAFVAPPFSGLDTLPSLGVVLLSLGVLLEDAFVVVAGAVALAAGIALEIVLGGAAIRAIGELF